jgi:hypothetical protein
VINNLEIDPDYYLKASLQISLPRNSMYYQGGRTYSSVVQGKSPPRRLGTCI